MDPYPHVPGFMLDFSSRVTGVVAGEMLENSGFDRGLMQRRKTFWIATPVAGNWTVIFFSAGSSRNAGLYGNVSTFLVLFSVQICVNLKRYRDSIFSTGSVTSLFYFPNVSFLFSNGP
jgi:hypothetical protein